MELPPNPHYSGGS